MTDQTPTTDPTEYMCPNCVTPWKCNGPHIPDQTPTTEAGRRLLRWLAYISNGGLPPPMDTGRLSILAIEAEARYVPLSQSESYEAGRADALREAAERVRALLVEHRECGKPKYDGCYSHVPMAHCRADGTTWPCDAIVALAVLLDTGFAILTETER